MKKHFGGALVAAIAVIASVASAGTPGRGAQDSKGSELLLIGPVEHVDARQGVAIVLGQRVHSPSVKRLQTGDAVQVFGTLQADGQIIASRIDRESGYVAGATPVLLTGIVTAVDTSIGQVQVGNLAVDYTALLAGDPAVRPEVGSRIQLTGVQPIVGGLFLAEGISGSGVQGISGSGVQGISGSGIQGISGSGVQGISGSGIQGISGSGVQGISGSGAY